MTSRIICEMVQKKTSEPKRRGRPRAYDPAQALARAADTFWKAGYAGTSLDDLSEATGMNRPSLYAAFGDKRDLYLKTLEHYREESRALARAALADVRRFACSSSASTTRRSNSISMTARAARLDRHGRDRRGGRRPGARVPRRQHALDRQLPESSDREGEAARRDRARGRPGGAGLSRERDPAHARGACARRTAAQGTGCAGGRGDRGHLHA